MKMAVLREVFRRSREDAAVHEIADGLDRDAAIAHDLVGAGIKRDDAVEHAGVLGGVELEKELAHRRNTENPTPKSQLPRGELRASGVGPLGVACP